MTLKFDGWPWKTIGHLLCTASSFVHHFKAIGKWKLELQSANAKFRSKSAIFCPVWPWNLTSDLENINRTPLLCYLKLCASFHSHLWIQNGVTVRKCPIWVKIGHFLFYVTFKFDRWPWKTIRYLFYATSIFVHHFITIGELKLELQSGNAQFELKSIIFLVMWPWNLTDDLEKLEGTSLKPHQALCIISSPLVNSNWSYNPETTKLGVDLCDLELWPWPFAWTLLLSLVITPECVTLMTRWWEHNEQDGCWNVEQPSAFLDP